MTIHRRTIAITGKGGSGKTTLAAVMTKLLAGTRDILSIDADSAIGLAHALGVEPGRTVADLRRLIIEDPKARKGMDEKSMAEVMGDALTPGNGFDLLVMGRPEGPGCYCAVNELLKYGIDSLSSRFDVTLIDCEAGPEQASRRVVKQVDTLIIVTDPSLRGARVAGSILEVTRADEQIRPAETHLVINRSRGDDDQIAGLADTWDLNILARLPEDPIVAEYDAMGRPLTELPDDSLFVRAVSRVVGSIPSPSPRPPQDH